MPSRRRRYGSVKFVVAKFDILLLLFGFIVVSKSTFKSFFDNSNSCLFFSPLYHDCRPVSYLVTQLYLHFSMVSITDYPSQWSAIQASASITASVTIANSNNVGQVRQKSAPLEIQRGVGLIRSSPETLLKSLPSVRMLIMSEDGLPKLARRSKLWTPTCPEPKRRLVSA